MTIEMNMTPDVTLEEKYERRKKLRKDDLNRESLDMDWFLSPAHSICPSWQKNREMMRPSHAMHGHLCPLRTTLTFWAIHTISLHLPSTVFIRKSVALPQRCSVTFPR